MRNILKILFTGNYWCMCQICCSWNMFWKGDHVVGTFKNICTVPVHCWYIKDAFAGLCQLIFEWNILDDILVDSCFH